MFKNENRKPTVLFNLLMQRYKGYKEPLTDSLDVPACDFGSTKMVAF